MQCIVVKSDEFENSSPLYIFPLNPDYNAARSLRSLRSHKTTTLVYGYFSLISLFKTNIYFYQFSRFFQNILHFRAFHCSQWKTRFIGLLLRGNIKISTFQNAMNQSSQGTKAPKAHDAVLVLCEHPLRILNAKTIKFWYSERQLVSVPKG